MGKALKRCLFRASPPDASASPGTRSPQNHSSWNGPAGFRAREGAFRHAADWRGVARAVEVASTYTETLEGHGCGNRGGPGTAEPYCPAWKYRGGSLGKRRE